MSLASLTDQRIRIAQSMADRAVDPTQIRALLTRLAEQVRTGVLPPYGGIPIIQTLTQKLSQMQNAQGVAQARQNAQRPPIAQEVMQQAQGAVQHALAAVQRYNYNGELRNPAELRKAKVTVEETMGTVSEQGQSIIRVEPQMGELTAARSSQE